MPKRDIQADRAELDAMFERAKRRNDPVFPFVYSIVSHYLDRTEEAERERDSLKQQLAEANAACADMRGALNITLSALPCALLCAEKMPDGSCALDERPCKIEQAKQRIIKALSSSAGRDLLERVRRGEEAERLLKRVDGMQKAAGNIRSSEASDWGGDWEELVERIDAYLKAGGKDA